MIELKSVDYTAPVQQPGTSDAENERATKASPGSKGTATNDRSRAASLLALGKTSRPLRRSTGGLETPIGADDRQRILETELHPWRMICALRIKSQLGEFIGTGWFAGPRTVITAGHCVYHLSDMGGWAEQIELTPGCNESTAPYSTFTARRFSAVDRWIGTHDPDFDVGCIHLDEPLGDKVGWFRTSALPAEALQQWLVNVSGYPADKPDRFDPRAGTQQFFHKNRILRVSDRRIFYDVDTSGGQSGAPVWIQADEGAEPTVVAIHAYGIGGTPAAFNVTANSAPRIIPELMKVLEEWMAK